MKKKLGTGIASWDGSERRKKRYGHIVLTDTDGSGAVTFNEYAIEHRNFDSLVGRKVELTAVVIEPRVSNHIGDKLLGVKPSMPIRYEEITIGVGWLHKTDIQWGIGFELWPHPELMSCREQLWLDPRILYRLHEQTIMLFGEETDQEPHVVEPFPEAKDFVQIQEADGSTNFQVDETKYGGIKPILTTASVEGIPGMFSITTEGFRPIKKD